MEGSDRAVERDNTDKDELRDTRGRLSKRAVAESGVGADAGASSEVGSSSTSVEGKEGEDRKEGEDKGSESEPR